MTQITSGIRGILSAATIYQITQDLVLKKHSLKNIIDTYLRPCTGQLVLDVGCGTGKIASYFSGDVRYVGVDLSPTYIEYAQKTYGRYGQFINCDLRDFAFATLGRPDLVLAMGLLHHLDDAEVLQLFHQVATIMAADARLVTMDPCWIAKTNPWANFIIAMDRGRNVRTLDHYYDLASQVFPDIKVTLRQDLLRIPYNHAILECRRIR